MVNSNSRSVRIGVRHHIYSAYVIPDAKLRPAFKAAIMDIAANIQNNNTEVAYYLCDLLIRDYGTHAGSSIDIGGSLYQTSYVARTYGQDNESTMLKISASASASFLIHSLFPPILNSQSQMLTRVVSVIRRYYYSWWSSS